MLMRLALYAVTAAVALATSAIAAPDLAGRYRLAEGDEAAGELELKGDGRFAYVLAVGALDEEASGRWIRRGEQACLTTEPTPKPPEFKRVAVRPGQEATVLVESAGGEGVPGIDVVIGFDSGDPVTGYTQYYGWSLPTDEHRPRAGSSWPSRSTASTLRAIASPLATACGRRSCPTTSAWSTSATPASKSRATASSCTAPRAT
jgi:hypothetical protein